MRSMYAGVGVLVAGYLVTVGRFRQFVNAVLPPDGGGGLAAGGGLGPQGYSRRSLPPAATYSHSASLGKKLDAIDYSPGAEAGLRVRPSLIATVSTESQLGQSSSTLQLAALASWRRRSLIVAVPTARSSAANAAVLSAPPAGTGGGGKRLMSSKYAVKLAELVAEMTKPSRSPVVAPTPNADRGTLSCSHVFTVWVGRATVVPTI